MDTDAAGEAAGAQPADQAEVREKANQVEAQTFQGKLVRVSPLPRPAPVVRLVDASAGPLQARLAEQNATARADSIEALAKWFPGYDFATAAQTCDDRRFTVLNLGAELFDHLDAITTVERLLAEHNLPGNRLRFSHGDPGKTGLRPDRVTDPARPQMNRVRPGPLVSALREGWTVIINGIDDIDPVIGGVHEHLERVYGCRVNTNVYLSWGEALGFGQHWDQHDTIIVPAAGAKLWKVYEPLALSPMRPWVGPQVSPRPVWEGYLEPGMALVIPRGWGHEVAGSDDLAVHYTIGVNRLTGTDVVERLRTAGGHQPILRADLAYDLDAPAMAYDKSLHDEPDSFRNVVDEVIGPDFMAVAVATYRARLPVRMFPSLYDLWAAVADDNWDDQIVRMPVPAGVHVINRDPAVVRLAFGDQLIEVANPVADLFAELADCRSHRVGDLPEVEDAPEARGQLCEELVEAGLLAIETDT